MRLLVFALIGVLAPLPAFAQPAAPTNMEVDPIRCWWRTSEGAVAVGQPLSAVITCAVIDTNDVRVVPDEAPLAVEAIQFAPFELLGGSHPADLRSGQRRFFQYEYSLRIVDPTVIGKDVTLAGPVLHYRMQSRVQAQRLEGRDLTYLLPPLRIRVLSTVPADALDIRDGSYEPFAAIEALRLRSRILNIAALALAVLGIIVLVPVVIRAIVGVRQPRAASAHPASDRAVLATVAADLAAAQSAARVEATPDLVSRALGSTRIAASYALDRRPRQRVMKKGDTAPEGRLLVKTGWVRRDHVAVSSPVSPEDVQRELNRLPLTASHTRRSMFEALHTSLTVLTRALYSQAGGDARQIEEAIDLALGAVAQLRKVHRWPHIAVVRAEARSLAETRG